MGLLALCLRSASLLRWAGAREEPPHCGDPVSSQVMCGSMLLDALCLLVLGMVFMPWADVGCTLNMFSLESCDVPMLVADLLCSKGFQSSKLEFLCWATAQ